MRDDPERRAIHPRNETSNGLFPVTDHTAEVLQKRPITHARQSFGEQHRGFPPSSCRIASYLQRRAEFCSRARKPKQKQACRLLQGYFPHMTKRNSAAWSQFRCTTCGKTTRYRPCTENTLRQRRSACACRAQLARCSEVRAWRRNKERWLWAQGDPSVFEEYLFIYQLVYLLYLVLLHHLENKES